MQWYKDNVPDFEPRCKSFFCDDTEGCMYEEIVGCTLDCEEDETMTCLAEGEKNSTVKSCISGLCKYYEDHPVCYPSESKDCSKVLEEQLTELNKKADETTLCYTASCNFYGGCEPVGLTIPSAYRKHKCMEPKCEKQDDGSWMWIYVATEANNTCVSDDCYIRQCLEDRGCVNVTDICEPQSNKCFKHSCDYDANGVATCKNTSLLVHSLCIDEECIITQEEDEHGDTIVTYSKEVRVKDLSSVCPESEDKHNLCKSAKCGMNPTSGESWCYYVDIPEPEECGDACTVCACDPKQGYVFSEKCPSPDNCTITTCDIDGVCGNQRIDCYDEVDMTDFPCFALECKPEANQKGYKCMKKLLPNAFIDICGNCIQDTGDTTNSGSSAFVGAQSEDLTLVTDCTGAPPKPLLTEGLAAASIALIILAAIIVGAILATSTAVTTKTLIDRARQANTTGAQSNPLYEGNETELANPTYAGDDA